MLASVDFLGTIVPKLPSPLCSFSYWTQFQTFDLDNSAEQQAISTEIANIGYYITDWDPPKRAR